MQFKLPTQLEGHYCHPLSSLVVVRKEKNIRAKCNYNSHTEKRFDFATFFCFKKSYIWTQKCSFVSVEISLIMRPPTPPIASRKNKGLFSIGKKVGKSSSRYSVIIIPAHTRYGKRKEEGGHTPDASSSFSFARKASSYF